MYEIECNKDYKFSIDMSNRPFIKLPIGIEFAEIEKTLFLMIDSEYEQLNKNTAETKALLLIPFVSAVFNFNLSTVRNLLKFILPAARSLRCRSRRRAVFPHVKWRGVRA